MTEEQIDELEKLIKSPFFTNSQVVELVEFIRSLQQQNKQLIEALTRISEADCSQDYDGIRESLIDVVETAEAALQQIQGKDEES